MPQFRILLLALLLIASSAIAQDTIFYANAANSELVGKRIYILDDSKNNISLSEAFHSDNYIKSKAEAPSLEVKPTPFWVKLVVANKTSLNTLSLNLGYPTIDSVRFYTALPDGGFDSIITGEFVPYYLRPTRHQDYIFRLMVPPGEARTFLFKVSASEPIQLPVTIGSFKAIAEDIFTRDLLFGMYAGIILVMLLYNLFLFFTVRDRSYLYYVGYILFTGLTQACLQGYAARFLYPQSFFLANAMVVWVPALSGIFAIVFINHFLQVRTFTPVLYRVLSGFLIMYCGILALSLTGNYLLCTGIMQLVVTLLAVVVYIIAVKITLKGYRPAKIFLLAWTIFIAAVVVFVLRNFGAVPYNGFSYYAMQIGSAIEVVLLSFALADKINLFRMEKEESQKHAMEALKENEHIVRGQNVMLEKKVNERTHELRLSNDGLNKAMEELKDAEAQLVESEKMASLGQLTAGIAHEINNPINFVTSNVKPLNRDVKMLLEAMDVMERIIIEKSPENHKVILNYKAEIDYDYLKEEIEQLLSGISDGASRTAEIVKGLRIFSRLDEDDLKKADINEGMDSTLIITNNMLNNQIKVIKHYGNLPLIECYPGKLNQVFLNMISNGIYAVRKKYGEKEGGELHITTGTETDCVFISIADNGTGMDESTKKRLFEPFFTTKDVGEGTGLGLSIAYNTINKHSGQVLIESQLGLGSKFTIKLPLVQK